VERFNSTLVAMLAMYVAMEQRDWDKYIRYCVFAYNTSRHEINKYTPFYLLFGRIPTLPIDVMSRTDSELYATVGDYARAIIRRMRVAHNLAVMHQREIHNKYREKALEKSIREYTVGDLVLIRYYKPKEGLNPKLSSLYYGPFKVVEKKSLVTYKVQLPQSKESQVVHVNRMKKF
jgi:hypothetical protein